MRPAATFLTLLSAPALLAQAPAPARRPPSLFQTLAEHRGGVMVVGEMPGWMQRLREPEMGDLLDSTLVEARPLTDPALAKLGISKPVVVLLSSAGKLLASWEGAPPKDLAAAFRSAGWISPIEELRTFVAGHPERVDVRWSLLRRLGSQVHSHPNEQTYQEFAEALDTLLRQDHWESVQGYWSGPRPESGEAKDNPLTTVALTHLEGAKEVIRRAPTNELAWQVLEVLAAWHPAHPRLAELVMELPVPRLGFSDGWGTAHWPAWNAVQAARDQLESLEDWPLLERYALNRLAKVARAGEAYHADLLDEWSGVVSYSTGPDAEKVSRPTRREMDGQRLGPWLLALYRAQVGQGKSAEAQQTLQRIQREADAGSRSQAEWILKESTTPRK